MVTFCNDMQVSSLFESDEEGDIAGLMIGTRENSELRNGERTWRLRFF
jgi:hypothetical protein